jgi:hypothetical protein
MGKRDELPTEADPSWLHQGRHASIGWRTATSRADSLARCTLLQAFIRSTTLPLVHIMRDSPLEHYFVPKTRHASICPNCLHLLLCKDGQIVYHCSGGEVRTQTHELRRQKICDVRVRRFQLFPRKR